MADPNTQAEPGKDPEQQVTEKPKNQEPQTQTLDQKIKAAVDTAVMTATAELEKNHKTELAGVNRAVSERDTEIEQLKTARMSDKERMKYEAERRDEELARREQTIKTKELRLIKLDVLDEVGVPRHFEHRINGNTEEELLRDAREFKRDWDKEIEKQSKEDRNKDLIKSGTKLGAGEEPSSITPEAFQNMSIDERLQLRKENKDVYDRLWNEGQKQGYRGSQSN